MLNIIYHETNKQTKEKKERISYKGFIAANFCSKPDILRLLKLKVFWHHLFELYATAFVRQLTLHKRDREEINPLTNAMQIGETL